MRTTSPTPPQRKARTIGALIAERAAEAPESPVLLSRDAPPLTSAALLGLVERTRAHLNAHGLGRGDRIALILPDHAVAQAAYLAVTPSAPAVPLNPKLTRPELEDLCRLTRVRAVLTAQDAPDVIAMAEGLGLPALRAHPTPERGTGAFRLSGGTPGQPARPGASDAQDWACVLTSSGTTGRPKVIPQRHGLVLDRLGVDVDILQLNARDVTANLRPPYLAGPLNIGLLASVYAGGAVVVPPGFDADSFFADLIDFGLTWYTGGPAYHQAILDAAPDNGDALARHRLRFLRSSGYALEVPLQVALEALFGVPCVQKYGSSEAGLITCNPLPPGRRKPGSSGPVQGCEVRILGADGVDAAPGAPGEILVRGPKVFEGYDDPAMNRTAFVEGWFRTGDLGAFDAEGYLTITGRATEIINRGGQKIAPSEVESAFRALPGVADALCFPVPHATLGQTSAIALIAQAGAHVQEAELRRRAGEHLARFKVPEVILFTQGFPRGPTGKPLRREAASHFGLTALPVEDTADLHPPRDLLEELWCRVLRIDQLHDDMHFTRAGGDSIRAIRLLLEVERNFNVTLPEETLYSAGATLSGLRNQIAVAGQSPAASAPHTALKRRVDRGADLPLTSWQKRIWAQSRMLPVVGLYNSSFALRFPGPFQPDVIRQAVHALISRHEALRAHFPTENGLPRQRFGPVFEPEITTIDLRAEPENLREQALQEALQETYLRPFDLEAGPLLRLVQVRVSEVETVVQLESHHTIADAISTSIASREFGLLYTAFSEGRPPDLPAVEWDYGDLVQYHAERVARDGGAMVARWVDRLSDVPPVIELPRDRPRPRSSTRSGKRHYFHAPPELAMRVRHAAAANGTTPFVLLMASFASLVARLTGRDRFVLGTGINTRPPQAHDKVVGFGLNTVPLRFDIARDMRFDAVVAQARQRFAEARSDADVPFDDLVRALADAEDRATPPLVQILFGFMPRGTRPEDTDFADRTLWNRSSHGARFDITMMLDDTREGLGGFVEYATEIYDTETIEALVARFLTLLDSQIADTTAPINRHDIMPPAERAQVAAMSRGPQMGYPRDASIVQVFRAVARRQPKDSAVLHGERCLTYAELDRMSDAYARSLVAGGVTAGQVVGLSTERTPAAIIGLLAIQKAGAAYQPLDPSLPAERIAAMVKDAGTTLALVQPGSCLALPAGVTSQALTFDGVVADGGAALPDVAPTDLAYVIFTSGSTGRAKGVEVTHRNVLSTVLNQPGFLLGAGTRVACTGSLGFDASVFEIFGALLNGGTLVLPDTVVPSINDYARMLMEQRVEVAWFTSGLFREMVDLRIDCFAGVRQVIVGGDVVPADRALRLAEACPDCRLTNGYGPTENTVFSITGPLTMRDLRAGAVPLGTPLANASAWILDDDRRPVPLGVEGDLYVGGDGVARGYRNRPDLTAQAFVPDPFDADQEARLYASGDRARFHRDGRISFHGRRDEQFKIRGFRVELAEIDAALVSHPAVADAVAFVLREEGVVRSISAAIIPVAALAPPSPADLRAHLARSLPSYMIPSDYALVERFPLNASGKIDRKALASLPGVAGCPTGEDITDPRTPIEEELHEIWTELLDRNDFGIDQSFFALGGDSLLILQLGFLVTEAFGITVPVINLLEAPTIRALAEQILNQLLEEDIDKAGVTHV